MKKLLFVLTITVLCQFSGYSQQTKADIQREQAQLKKDLADLNQTLTEIRSSRKKSLSELYLVQKKIQTRQALVENIQKEIVVLNTSIQQNEATINTYSKQLDTLKRKYAANLAFAYKNRSNYNYVNFIFSAASFNDAIKRITYLRSYRQYRESQVANIKNLQATLRAKIDELNGNKKEKGTALVSQNTELTSLQTDQQEKDKSMEELKSREGEVAGEIEEKNKVRRRLQSNLNRIIAEEIAAAKAEAKRKEKERQAELARQKAAEEARLKELARRQAEEKARQEAIERQKAKERQEALAAADAQRAAAKTAQEEENARIAREKLVKEQEAARAKEAQDAADRLAKAKEDEEKAKEASQTNVEKLRSSRSYSVLENSDKGLTESIDFEKNKGRLPWPSGGVVISSYGKHSIPGTKIQEDNPGIDISAPVGSPVRSVANGVVSRIVDDEGTGEYTIFIRHGKYFTIYSNVRNPVLKNGSSVMANTLIGSAGPSLEGDGGMISFLIANENGANLNPESWLRRR
ncbi:peptidoglycan DD-metalloendopeptidase family protein [Rhizosphaericola mali]|uniref:Peptidoglycan DD-metalloendopeptidase family protein n=1 Tax=Rhizosphaericola mali TaxID=2545455 RepID=A0A5P2G038_9BACT|nr:peptidoglycan DD-metalloendopeptidase family protein [Rhizosphaericola mali]QES87182.1 peptidoglycan DD-metalloendopeptidase family protein [Rhizosphaericola mali]